MTESYVVILKDSPPLTYIMTRDAESLKAIDAKKMDNRLGFEWYVNDKPVVVIDRLINRGYKVVAMTYCSDDCTFAWTLQI